MSNSRETEKLSKIAAPDQIAEAAENTGCDSVAFTYNDPVIFLEYAVDTAIACHERGLRTLAVTAGYICEEPRREFFSHMDAVNVDLKAFDDTFYRRLCSGRLDPVLDTLRYLRHETDVWLEITTLLIPGMNDSEAEIGALTHWIAEELGQNIPLHFTAFHPAWRMSDLEATSLSTLRHARDIAREAGLHFVYMGNRADPDGAATECPGCGERLIERLGFSVSRQILKTGGCCPSCGELIPGVFA